MRVRPPLACIMTVKSIAVLQTRVGKRGAGHDTTGTKRCVALFSLLLCALQTRPAVWAACNWCVSRSTNHGAMEQDA